ncbi:hypothetical protein RPG20_002091 [Escherichia coli]|nr:hypothetical protein [Escherichia coli]ELI2208801.1 hypothetical protein [Escherichia coli]
MSQKSLITVTICMTVSRPDNPNSNTLGLRNALAIAGAKNGMRRWVWSSSDSGCRNTTSDGLSITICWRAISL